MLRAGAGLGGCKRAECTELKPQSPARIQFVECPTKQGAWESITLPSGPVNGLEWEGLARTSVNVQVFSAEDSPLPPRKRSGSDKRARIELTSIIPGKQAGEKGGKSTKTPRPEYSPTNYSSLRRCDTWYMKFYMYAPQNFS